MAHNNLHRITGTTFLHAKPGLCHRCAHRHPFGIWEGFCEARDRILSVPKDGVQKGRCAQFEEVTGDRQS